jgi:hypothetical protein
LGFVIQVGTYFTHNIKSRRGRTGRWRTISGGAFRWSRQNSIRKFRKSSEDIKRQNGGHHLSKQKQGYYWSVVLSAAGLATRPAYLYLPSWYRTLAEQVLAVETQRCLERYGCDGLDGQHQRWARQVAHQRRCVSLKQPPESGISGGNPSARHWPSLRILLSDTGTFDGRFRKALNTVLQPANV